MELIHPQTAADVVEAVREANAAAARLLVVGGRRHMDKGNPAEVDAELWMTQLDRIVSHEPAEMVVVVEAGLRVGELDAALSRHGQEWPSDAPEDATVGGVVAADMRSARQLRVGRVGDTVLEATVVTGDGRLVTSGARTVKNVSGYDLHRLAVGSLGTLGVIVRLALRLRPLPHLLRTLHAPGELERGEAVLDAVPGAAGVLATPGEIEVRLEGWPEEVDQQTHAARAVLPRFDEVDGGPYPAHRPWDDAEVVAEVAAPPSTLGMLAEGVGERWGASLGVGLLWVGLDAAEALGGEASSGALAALRARAAEVGGIAPVLRGPGGLGEAPLPAREVHERLKRAFDPNGVLAPGRFWGGI